MRLPRFAALTGSLLFFACSSTTPAPPAAVADSGVPPVNPEPDASVNDAPIGGDRPVTVRVPPSYKAGTPAPLVIMLHGYSASGLLEEIYLGLNALSDARGFLYATPDGTVDASSKRFWNTTYACCDFGKTGVDDTKYVSALITQIQARYSVDPKRVFLVGHSNGGFMSHRMACERSDQIAAIVSLAGSMGSDPTKCAPAQGVSVLQIHGTKDETIAYEGSQLQGVSYPGAETVTREWARINGCGATPDTTAPALDLDTKLAGGETKVTKYSGCKPGGHAELWSIEGGSHIPSLTPAFSGAVVDFLYAHPKP